MTTGATGLLCSVVVVVALAAPCVLRLRRCPADAPGLFALAIAVSFGLTGLTWLGTPENPGPGLTIDDVVDAMWLVALALAAFDVGVLVVRPLARRIAVRHDRPADLSWPYPGWRAYALAYAATLVAAVGATSLGAFGYAAAGAGSGWRGAVGGGLAFIGGLGGFVVLAAGIAWLRTNDRARGRLTLALVLTQAVVGFVAGFKGQSILPVAALALAVVTYGHRLPARGLAVGALVVVFVLLPANRAYRAEARTGGISVGTAVEILSRPGNFRPDRSVVDAGRWIGSRFRNIDAVALVHRDTPTPFARGDGSTYALLPLIVFVPRPLWDGKPVMDLGTQNSHTYWDIPMTIETSTPITIVGDLDRNFRWPGIVGALTVYGALLALLTALWERSRSPRTDVIYLYFAVTGVVYVESDLPTMISIVSKSLPFAALLAWWLLPGRRRPAGATMAAGVGPIRQAHRRFVDSRP